MLIEVAANICIESLNLEPSVFKEIDKLAPIAKFDFFLRTNFRNKKIPSGIGPVQKAQELKRLRDAFVHPKKQPVLWTRLGDNSERGVSERTQFLDMSKNPNMWGSSDAESAMRGAHEFLAFIFRDLCKYTKIRTTLLLFSDEPNLSAQNGGTYYYHWHFRYALRRWQVDVSYFKMGTL